MADKYIRHGATFNGDGTSSAEAASNGAAGAWNTITYLEGTTPAFGSLGAGDTVYIRSKDAAGADITRTLAADVSLGSTAATDAAPIAWVVDGGTVWSGVSGTLKYTSSASANNAIVLQSNILIAEVQDALVFEYTGTTPTGGHYLAEIRGQVYRALFDASANTSTNLYYLRLSNSLETVLESPHIKWGRIGNLSGAGGVVGIQNAGIKTTLIDPDIELLYPTPAANVPLFWAEAGTHPGCDVLVLGGRVRGVGATTGQCLVRPYPSGAAVLPERYRFVGTDIPRAMSVSSSTGFPSNVKTAIELIGCDGGIGGHLEEAWGLATSRTDNNPPYLSAALPDTGATKWSWRVYPFNASQNGQLRLPTIKMFTGTAAAQVITQELLIADTMAPTKRTVWMTVEYIDNTTGLPKHVTSRNWAGGALDSSTAAWSATSWGMVTLVKRKISVTTPTAVKPDTVVAVTLWGIEKSATANDIYFVDPDFQMAAA